MLPRLAALTSGSCHPANNSPFYPASLTAAAQLAQARIPRILSLGDIMACERPCLKRSGILAHRAAVQMVFVYVT